MHALRAQVIDHLAVVRLGKKAGDVAGHDGADVGDLAQRLLVGGHQRLQRPEVAGQRLRGGFADVGNAQCVQQALQRGLAASVDRRHQVLRPAGGDLAGLGGLRLAFAGGVGALLDRDQAVHRESVQVGDGANVRMRDQHLDQPLAKAVDVHRAAAGEVEQRLHALRGTVQAAGTTGHDLPLLALDRAAADRAVRRHREGRMQRRPVGCKRAFGFDHAHHFRDHVSGAPHDDGVAQADVQPRHLVGVVQRRLGDGHPAHVHRLHHDAGGCRAGATDGDVQRQHAGARFLRGELVRDRPTRCPRDEAHCPLLVDAVELVDHAVDVERQRVAPGADAGVIAEHAVESLHHRHQIAHRKTHRGQPRQRLRMRGRGLALHFAERIGVERERPLRGHARILLPQRAGSAVARIGQRLAAGLAHACVVGFEIGARQDHFTAHFQHGGRAFGKLTRNRANRAQVGGDVLAGRAIAAGGALHEGAGLVAQADRQAIEFRFGAEHRVGEIQLAFDACHEFPHLVRGEGIAQRQHRQRMRHLREAP